MNEVTNARGQELLNRDFLPGHGGAEVTGTVIEARDDGYVVDLGDGRNLIVNVTDEGIIMDVFDGLFPEDEHLGTVGMMFDEWADWIVERIDPSLKIGEQV